MTCCCYLVLHRVLARRSKGSWEGSPAEIFLLLLIIDVPGIVGAAGKLMETAGLFRFNIVELWFCVFWIPAEVHMEGEEQRDKPNDHTGGI